MSGIWGGYPGSGHPNLLRVAAKRVNKGEIPPFTAGLCILKKPFTISLTQNAFKSGLCLAPRSASGCLRSPSQAAQATLLLVDGLMGRTQLLAVGKVPHAFSANPIRKDPEDSGWGRTRMFYQSGEDVKIGKRPVGSICKHFVNDPIFPSICSRLTCQLHGSNAGCSNGKGWKSPRLTVTSIPSLKAINSQQLRSDNASSLK